MTTAEIILSLFGVLLGFGNTWGLFIIRSLRDDIEQLRTADQQLSESSRVANSALNEKMAVVRELVIGQYVTHAQFDSAMTAQTRQIMGRMDEMFRYLRPPHAGEHGSIRSTDL